MQILLDKIDVQNLGSPLFNGCNIDVLRLDQLHPIISGNKWFKLKYHLQQAKQLGFNTIATFGGAFSNHIVATAFACKQEGLQSIGIIRGEQPANLSPTLQAATHYGMCMHYVSRTAFKDKTTLQQQFEEHWYWVNEGGYSPLGMLGAKEILSVFDTNHYTHFICSCGTGTMMAGLLASALPSQKVIGVSALKGNSNAPNAVLDLLPVELKKQTISILHQYHFGGYAKHTQELIDWMHVLWQQEKLPTDVVYTSKLLFAVHRLCQENFFTVNDKVLVIHSGGLQGNLSLPANTLPF
jgi:1-aminocyclopropane-1-carboxylate deaminase